jgi:secreted PhoX family phosphatase
MSIDPDAISSNSSDNPAFGDILAARLTRRSVLGGALGAAAIGFLDGPLGLGRRATAAQPKLGFTPIPTGSGDAFVVPDGYVADVIIPWGTPIRAGGPAWRKDASNTAAEQLLQVGAHHDGMHFFGLDNGGKGRRKNRRGLLVLNHEYIDRTIHYTDGDAVITQEKVNKALAAHGVTIIEVALVDGKWQHVDSPLNRRVTPLATPVTFSGPVRPEHPLLQSMGQAFGTINNCSHGVTPWGTYLACEENWNGYFGTAEPFTPSAVEARYGLTTASTPSDYRWFTADDRWDLRKNPDGPYRWGWVVEIDPFDPTSMPVKRTALGRIKHEGALVTESRGRIVVYTGDDQDGDYIYKFVGNAPWRQLRAHGTSPLDEGTLYVAQFHEDGDGTWVPIVHGTGNITAAKGFVDQADVLLRTRMAADAAGATKMDRPEWIAENPRTGELFVTLTNGTSGPNAPNPRDPNPYGHIIRWRERNGDKTDTSFKWDIFVLAGDPDYDPLVELAEEDIFGSPDGLHFDRDGRLWIQTDVSNSSQNLASRGYDQIANNAMLACDPRTGEIRRFAVGPRGSELTGAVTTPDQETIFVNVQHPGEATTAWGTPTPANPRAVSNWPDFDPAGRPRSATVAIRKVGGGKVGT